MKWIEERDALIAQSKAFVEAVTRRSADRARLAVTPVHSAAVAPRSAPPPPPPTAPVTKTGAPPAAAAPLTKISASPAPPAPAPKASEATRALPTLAPLERKFDQVSMTSEIRSRIAAFR